MQYFSLSFMTRQSEAGFKEKGKRIVPYSRDLNLTRNPNVRESDTGVAQVCLPLQGAALGQGINTWPAETRTGTEDFQQKRLHLVSEE